MAIKMGGDSLFDLDRDESVFKLEFRALRFKKRRAAIRVVNEEVHVVDGDLEVGWVEILGLGAAKGVMNQGFGEPRPLQSLDLNALKLPIRDELVCGLGS